MAKRDDATLLNALRNEWGLTGTRFGCGGEDCGACTVLVDGELCFACSKFVGDLAGRQVQTIEGLSGPLADALRHSFIETSAGQCGYCLSGVFVTAYHLLQRIARPTRSEIAAALDRHLCRCGAHASILRAIDLAADRLCSREGRE
jgi:aerobic-type carbon monoxide dehydrogenase small subunit (CoxS/CutS family)